MFKLSGFKSCLVATGGYILFGHGLLHPHTRQELSQPSDPILKSKIPAEARAQHGTVSDAMMLGLKRLLESENRTSDGKAAKSRKKDPASVQKDARMANVDLVRSLDHAMRRGVGHGLAFFMPTKRMQPLLEGQRRCLRDMPPAKGSTAEAKTVRRSCIESEAGQCCYESPQRLVNGKRKHPVCHMLSDLGPVGHPGANWLCHGLGLRSTVAFDILHRRVSDVDDALKDAGLRLLRLEFTQVLKLRQGPFGPAGGGYHEVLRASAAEMFSYTDFDTNLLFEIMCSSISSECDVPGHHGSVEHMQAVWSCMQSVLTSPSKGDNTKRARWWNFEENSRAFLKRQSMTLLNLLWLGFRRGWWKSYQSCPLNAKIPDASECNEGEPDEAGLEALELEACADDLAKGAKGDESALTAGTLSTTAAREEMQKRRAQFVGTLHFSTLRLCVHVNVRLWRGMAWLPEGLEQCFQSCVTRLKTVEGTRDLVLGLVDSKQTDAARSVFTTLVSPEFSRQVGFDLARRCPSQMSDDTLVAECMWKYAHCSVGACSMSDLFFQVPPQCFMGLTSREPGSQQRMLKWLSELWSAYEALEAEAKHNRKARTFIEDTLWPLQQWSREVFVCLLEVGFDEVPAWLAEELEAYSRGHWSTLLCENLNKELRRVPKCSPSGRFSARAAWHTCTLGSSVSAEHDRPQPKVTCASRGVAAPTCPSNLYKCSDDSCSLPDVLKGLTQDPATWPTHSAFNLRLSSMATFLLHATAGDWQRIELGYRSLLMTPGTLVKQKSSKRAWVVVQRTRFGFLGWQVDLKAAAHGHTAVSFGSPGEHSLKFGFVEKFASWKVCSVCVRTPASGPITSTSVDVGNLVITVSGKGSDLLHASALRGFRNLTVTDLRALHSDLEVPFASGCRPRTECELVCALVRFIIPDTTDEKLQEVLGRRGKSAAPEVTVSDALLLKSSDMLDMVLEEADDEDAKLELQKLRAKAEAEHRRQLKVDAELHAVSTSAGRASSSSCKPVRSPVTSQVRESVAGYSVEEARQWAPPGCTLTKEMRWHTRWRATSQEIGGVRSKSFSADGLVSDFKAMVWVLNVAWRHYTAIHGQACPWEFGVEMV